MASGLEGGRDTRQSIRHDWIRLALAIGAHEQNPGPVFPAQFCFLFHRCANQARAAQDRSKATSAPIPEQTAFTASLSNFASPPVCRVAVPQV